MDFNISTYLSLLGALKDSGYAFQTFENFLIKPEKRGIILRHDVDLKPINSLLFAKLQEKEGIQGTYYFRAVKESWDEDIIKEIHSMGHEVGYHYECLTTTKGDFNLAFEDFKLNLNKLRELVPVQTICMHGSPLSRFDSKDLWKKYDYKDLKLIGEPYFDIDFNKVLYLTDTGRTWNNRKISVRDHVSKKFNTEFKNTFNIIEAANSNKLPQQIMFNFHPQRWTNNKLEWSKEYILQNMKNQIKRFIIKN
tara:strand:+ start:1054 stop:1806 length:753 start_codon:yes stop_codon:yes gene_type:complete